MGSCRITTAFWDNPERHQRRKIFIEGRTSGSTHGYTFCLEKEMGRCLIVHCLMVYRKWTGWMVRNLESTWLEAGRERHLERFVTGCEDTYVSCKCASEGHLSRGIDLMDCFMHHRPFSLAIPVITLWTHVLRGHGERDEGWLFMNSTTWISTHQSWPDHSCCWMSHLPAGETNMAHSPR